MPFPRDKEEAGFKIAEILSERMVCDDLTPEEIVGRRSDAVSKMFVLGESLKMLGFKEAAEIALGAWKENQG